MRSSCMVRIALLPDDDERSLGRSDRILAPMLKAVQREYRSGMGQKDTTLMKEPGVLVLSSGSAWT